MIFFTRSLTLTFTFTVLISLSVFSQKTNDYQLHFKNVVLETSDNFNSPRAGISYSTDEIFDGKFYKIIQFDEIPDDSQRSTLETAGVQLLDYIPHFGFFAAIDAGYDANVLSGLPIRAVVDISRAIKLAPMLYEENYPDYALRSGGKIELIATVFAGTNTDLAQAYLQDAGFEVTAKFGLGEYYYVVAEMEQIDALAAIPFVNYVEPRYPDPVPDNYTGRTSHRSNAIATDFESGRQYDGTGVGVMLQDDGKIGPHIDFEGRIKQQFVNFFGGDHGDHCAGIIAAAGNLDPKARGNAFDADLYVYSAAPSYPGFSSIPSHYFDYDIRVTSTSYSDGCNAGYTSLARSLDLQIINYPSLMHVFSAGNNGSSNCGYGAGAGWGNITGGHKVGKNVITVANLNYLDNLSGSSSRGPAHDGRIKPDISAKGTDVYSTLPNDEYGNKTGTSMSCPGVAGVVTQLFDAYRQLNNGDDPTGGLLKGIVLNTAEDLGNPGPDFRFGWGRINALRAAKVLEENRYEEAELANSESNEHTFEVPENTAQVRVMIYWTDVQASVNSNWALVNNLDMTITDPQSNEWMPWVLNHYPHPDSLNLPAFRGNDDRNNVEQITIDFPESGTYTLTVDGTSVPQGPQTYYVIYEYIPASVVLTYPFGGEPLTPGETEVLRWDAFGDDKSFTIELSLDDGNTWQVIQDNIDGNFRYYEWDVANAITSTAILRISDGETTSQSEPFTIIPRPENITIDWACEDAVHLSWNEITGASGYTVWKLGERVMEMVGTTDINTMIVYDTPANQIDWFSVSANTPDGASGQRAIAVKKNPGVFNCNQADAWLKSVPSVDWGVYQSCMQLENVGVTAELKNFGLDAIENPDFSFRLNDGEIFTETFSGTVQPDSLLHFTFGTTIDISQVGTYELEVSVNYANDQNPGNDTYTATLEVIEGASVMPGALQSFDAFVNCMPAPICELAVCDLSENYFNLQNELHDDIDWRTWSGSTGSPNTGPSFDHTTGTSDGKYLYIRAAVVCFFKEASLMLPCVDLTEAQAPALDFWYHAYGSDIGSLHVDVFDGETIHRDIVLPVIGNQGDEWKNMVIDLSEFVGKSVGIRIRGRTGGGVAGDLSLDDISITEVTSVGNGSPITGNLTIYPNPTTGAVNIKAGETGDNEYFLTIFDLYGRVVYTRPAQTADGRLDISLDLAHMPRGLYFVRLNSSNKTYQSKLTLR
jgi:hypothetical protein